MQSAWCEGEASNLKREKPRSSQINLNYVNTGE